MNQDLKTFNPQIKGLINIPQKRKLISFIILIEQIINLKDSVFKKNH